MTQDDLNQIRDVVKEEVVASEKRVMTEVGNFIEDKVLTVLEAHTKLLDSNSKALKQIISNTENISDDTVKLDKRVTKVEGHLGITPPPELTIVR